MQLLLLTCAETCVIDQTTQRLSLFNLLEEVQTPTFPAAIYSVAVFTLWEREAAEPDPNAQLIVRLNNNQLLQAPLKVAFQEKLRTRTILTVHGLVMAEPGTLIVEVRAGDDIARTWRVPIAGIPQVVGAPA
jgi:hypothetical protein